MELRMAPASPPTPPPKDSAATSPYATAPSSPRGRLVRDEGAAAGGLFLTAPPSPNPFDLLPPATPRLTGADPFDMFHHFTSAPASPRRAAAIYAHFAEGNGGRDGAGEEEDDGGDTEFQPRRSYATGGSSVPFDWEERPGTPKRGLGGGAAANEPAWDTDFEFGTTADKAAPAETLTTADELFEKGKIRPLKPKLKTADEPKVRPLKPPPGLLDGGSVASSPRSPMTKGGMWSPRRRSRVGSGVDFDPFAAALLEATKAPSPLGRKEANAPGSPPKKPAIRPASRSAGWRSWRLSDLLLFRSSSDGARVSKQEPIFKPAEQVDAPVKKAIAQPATTTKASVKGDDMGKAKKHGNRSAAAAADSVAGCARLSPLQRLAKGLGAYSWHYGRGMATKG
ncbi:hypothetical protein BAE44_0022292 [Dichanthelium oligosanthes]|uniref:Uncharacterized protein n=1 Tax=Dichanthelium oligosanthes TaxID=888268 RepID=A0A1E5UUZ2_9POAL|nr:hypothetical protein BAE44_0022292 [Dichanthelium oligosanthes]